jgi:PadR family transcriptional regulator PadR
VAKPRRGFLFGLDTKVLDAGWHRHGVGQAEFYGLEVANDLGVPKGSVYKSLARLVDLGLIDRRWEAQDIAAAAGRPPRRYYALNQHGRDALPHARMGRKALGRQWPPDSNSVSRSRRRGVPARLRRLRRSRGPRPVRRAWRRS